jgi:hypothetical protein
MCYYFAMQHLSQHNPNPWPIFIQWNDLNTGLFLRTYVGGGRASTKRDHTILSVERWQMVVGDKKFGVVSYVLVGWSWSFLPQKIFCIFPPLGLKYEHFLKQIFGYTALHCALIDRIWSVKYSHGMFMYNLPQLGHSEGRSLVKLSGPNSHEVLPWLAPSREILKILSL